MKAALQTLMGEGCGPRPCNPSPNPSSSITELPSPERGRNSKRPIIYGQALVSLISSVLSSPLMEKLL
jgi:hypothetical protein